MAGHHLVPWHFRVCFTRRCKVLPDPFRSVTCMNCTFRLCPGTAKLCKCRRRSRDVVETQLRGETRMVPLPDLPGLCGWVHCIFVHHFWGWGRLYSEVWNATPTWTRGASSWDGNFDSRNLDLRSQSSDSQTSFDMNIIIPRYYIVTSLYVMIMINDRWYYIILYTTIIYSHSSKARESANIDCTTQSGSFCWSHGRCSGHAGDVVQSGCLCRDAAQLGDVLRVRISLPGHPVSCGFLGRSSTWRLKFKHSRDSRGYRHV